MFGEGMVKLFGQFATPLEITFGQERNKGLSPGLHKMFDVEGQWWPGRPIIC